MAHIPVNHPMRPIYRTAVTLIGLYILVFGVFGVIRNAGDPLFDRGSDWVLGLKTNLAFAILSVFAGAILLVGVAIGRNIGHMINLVAGIVFIVAGLFFMTVMQTSANFLNFSMVNTIASLVFGLAVLTCGLYDKVGTLDEAAAEERFRRRHPARAPVGWSAGGQR